MSADGFIPLSRTIPDWPSDIFSLPAFLDQIGLRDYDIYAVESENRFGLTGTLLWFREIAADLPLVQGCSVALLNESNFTAAPFEVAILPKFSFRLPSITISFRWATDLLRTVQLKNGKWVRKVDPQGNPVPVTLRMDQVGVAVDLDGDIEIILPAGAPLIGLGAVELGSSGFILEIDGIAPYFSAKQPPPVGAPPEFRGVAIQSAKLHLPPDFDFALAPNSFVLEHVLIGTGGVSGIIRGEWQPTYNPSTRQFSGEGAGTLFGLPFGLRSLALEFKHNLPIGATIRGKLLVPFFDEPVDVEVGIALDGSFQVKIAQNDGLYTLTKDGILRIQLDSIGFHFKDGRLMAVVSGQLTPLFGAPTLKWPSFQVKELAIDSDGNVHLEGGWLNLRDQYTLDFHNFQIEITRLGFGKAEDGGKWVGFSGGIKLVDGLTAGASVEGLRITWYDDDADLTRISMDGVGVEFAAPGVLDFKGFVAYRKLSDTEHRFDGDVRLTLHALKGMEFDARIVIGSAGAATFYAIYLGAELPAGIPLGATGLGLYGMAGLFANQMVPGKLPNEGWYENADGSNGWYKRDGEGVANLAKWTNTPGNDSLALGAGVTLGTISDNGFAFSGKVLLAIVFPGPIVLIEGRANILQGRAGLNSGEPNFRMLGVIDGNAQSVLFALDAAYKYDDSGTLIDIKGGAEAFFKWNDANAWHLYLGQKEPRERRIRAQIFKAFGADAYFMLDAGKIQMGAYVGYNKSWKFGRLGVEIESWIEGDAVVNWRPAHFHGQLWQHGAARLRAYGFKIGLNVDARLSADIFDPYHIRGQFRVKINLPWPLPDPGATITLEWGPEKQWPALPQPLQEVAIEHLKVTTKWPLAYATLAAEPGGPPDLNALPTVPLDARPSLTFSRPMHDTSNVGGNAQLPIPQSEWIGDPARQQGPAEVTYRLQAVALYKRAGSAWQLIARTPPAAGASAKLYGTWANIPRDGASEEISQSKLLVWSKTPFDYARHAGREWDEWFIDRFPSYPCPPVYQDQEICCTFDNIDTAVPIRSPWVCSEYPLRLSWSNADPEVRVQIPDVDSQDPPVVSLFFADIDSTYLLWIELGRAAKQVKIALGEQRGFTYSITWYDSQSQAHGPLVVTEDSAALEIAGQDMMLVKIVVTNGIWITGICVTTGLSEAEHDLRAALVQHTQDELVHWTQTDAVLEPHTIYRLIVTARADGTGHGPLQGQTRANTQLIAADFRTGGPPGVQPNQFSPPLAPSPQEFTSGLDDLRPYVRQTIPPTIGADNKPLLPRPVYRAYDVQVDFNENYVDLMYRLGQRDLGLYLYDQNNRPVRDSQGRLVALSPNWTLQEQITLKESARQWFDVLAGNACFAFARPAVTPDRTLVHSAEYLLEADSLHEARLLPLLLHEDFGSYAAGTAVGGPSGSLGLWRVTDLGSGGPSRWEIDATGTPPGHFIVQTSGIAGGSDASDSLDKPGTLLLFERDAIDAWDDYRLNVFMRATSGDGALGLVFRYRDSNNYYRYAFDRRDGYRRLVRFTNGTATRLANDSFIYNQNQDYLVTVEAIGSLIRIYQDGALVFEVTDTTHTRGRAGLYCWRNAGARFADVRVDDFRPAAPVVYRFGFTTSRFANVFHHLHSFRERLWPTEVPSALPDTDLTTRLGRAVAPSGLPTEQEMRDYDFLAQALLGAAALQQPTEVQLLRIMRNDTTHALLLLSPEPLDWERTGLALAASGTLITASRLPERLKISGVTFGTGQPNQESVQLILHQDTNLSSWRIEYRSLADSAAGGEWLPYYTFTSGDESSETFRSGTRVHIYAGNANAAPAAPPNTVQRFIATGSESGTLRLPGAGAELRLVRADGTVEHARQFLPDSAFSSQAVQVLRKADGTGFFLVASSLPQRTYRLAVTYRRDIGEGKPRLREAGHTEDEQVILDIPWS